MWCTNLNPPRCIISRDVIFNEGDVLEKKKLAEKELRKDLMISLRCSKPFTSHQKMMEILNTVLMIRKNPRKLEHNLNNKLNLRIIS